MSGHNLRDLLIRRVVIAALSAQSTGNMRNRLTTCLIFLMHGTISVSNGQIILDCDQCGNPGQQSQPDPGEKYITSG